jgi:glycosyltransferase involved in cell wall biosynthesis
MACGVPAVGFDTGGIPDIIRPDITGLLVPSRDTNALQSAIAQLLNNSDKQRMMGYNCRKIAAEEFSLEIQARNYFKLYNRLRQGCV